MAKIPIIIDDPRVKEAFIEKGEAWDKDKQVFPSRFVVKFTEAVDGIDFPTEVSAELGAAVATSVMQPMQLTNVFPDVKTSLVISS